MPQEAIRTLVTWPPPRSNPSSRGACQDHDCAQGAAPVRPSCSSSSIGSYHGAVSSDTMTVATTAAQVTNSAAAPSLSSWSQPPAIPSLVQMYDCKGTRKCCGLCHRCCRCGQAALGRLFIVAAPDALYGSIATKALAVKASVTATAAATGAARPADASYVPASRPLNVSDGTAAKALVSKAAAAVPPLPPRCLLSHCYLQQRCNSRPCPGWPRCRRPVG